MMRKAKKPTSAMVTAPMAAMRDAPSALTNSTRPCTELHPLAQRRHAPHWARFARWMVSTRLISVIPTHKSPNRHPEVRAEGAPRGATAFKSAIADLNTKRSSEIGETRFRLRRGRILRGPLRGHLRMTERGLSQSQKRKRRL